MKRLIRLILFTIILLTSCEKPFIPDEAVDDHSDGNLVVNVFQVEQLSFGSPTSRSTLSDFCQRLVFAVYDESGKVVRRSFQKAEDAGFGAVRFKLDSGTYQLVVIGHSSSGNPDLSNITKIKFSNENGYSDTFLHYSTLVVDDDVVSVEVNLRRVVSLCRVVFTDPVPSNVTNIRFYFTGGSGAFDATTGLGSINSIQTIFFPVEVGQQPSTFDLYTFLHDTEGTLQLHATAYNVGNIVYERMFRVPMKQRAITKLSGPFFSDESDTNINIVVSINNEWESEETINF